MEDQSSAAILARGVVFLAWFSSGILSIVVFMIGFGAVFFMPVHDVDDVLSNLPTQIFLLAPLASAIAWVFAYLKKLRSPWIEAIAFAAPAYQIACVTRVMLIPI